MNNFLYSQLIEPNLDNKETFLILDDGTAICPMSDDEGNEAGSIACMGEKVEVETIPVMRERI
mgnify:CR=1 FL=1